MKIDILKAVVDCLFLPKKVHFQSKTDSLLTLILAKSLMYRKSKFVFVFAIKILRNTFKIMIFYCLESPIYLKTAAKVQELFYFYSTWNI